MSVLAEGEKCSCGFDEANYKLQSQWLPPGTVLHDSILLGKVIGDGGFGITYIGLDLNLEMKVAVKEFYMSGYCGRNTQVSPDVLTEGKDKTSVFEANKEKFIGEARILARFSKEPGIVSVNRFFKENNTAYIVMEYVEGDSLKEYVTQKGKLSVKETLVNIAPIINALEKMHGQHIYHRDISPDNIILTKNQGMKLLDFGSAREKLEEYKTMTVVLKKAYSPIEQYETHGNQGPWSDIYSLCATIYNCITGKAPDSAYDRFMNDSMLSAHEINPVCDEEISAIVSKGMQVDAKERYQSVEELKEALTEYVNNHPDEYGKDIFLSSPARMDVDEGANEKRDYFIITKKFIKRAFLALLGIVCAVGVIWGIKVCTRDKDEQIIYLTYPEDVSAEQLEAAHKAINDRLSKIFGKGKYKVKKGNTYSTVTIDLEDNEKYSEAVVKKYLFRPDKLSLAYSTDLIDDNIEIFSEDIAAISQDSEYEESYYIELTDSGADKISKKRDEWISKTAPREVTENNLGKLVIGYEEYDPFSSNPELNTIQNEVLSPEEIVDGCMRLVFDYDLWKEGITTGADRTIIEFEVSDDAHRLLLASASDYECLKTIFNYQFMDDDYNILPETNASFPVLWEKNLSGDDSLYAVGAYQKEPEYFGYSNKAAVDVKFLVSEKNANLGNRVNNIKYIQDVFDTLEVEYALGRLADDDYSIVVRLPIEYAAEEIYVKLMHGPDDSAISLSALNIDMGEEDYLHAAYRDYIKWPITYADNKVHVNLVDFEDYKSRHSYTKDYEGFVSSLKVLGNDKICWGSFGPGKDYLIGQYDSENSRIVFDKSSYSADGTIPPELSVYIKLINSVYSVKTNGYDFPYEYMGEQNSEKSYELLREPVSRAFENHINETVLQNVKNKLTETLGAEPEVSQSGSGYEVILKQSITDSYAKNITRIVNAIIDANLFENNDIFTLHASEFLFRVVNADGSNQANIRINDEEKLVTLFFWKNDLSEDEKKIFDSQLEQIKELTSDGEGFSGYNVEINNVTVNR